MVKPSLGRDQSYARVVNNELVIQKLRESDYSATELAEILDLSHAAMSSILKGLLKGNIIKISYSKSKAGKGRKQVYYTLNEKYGLIIVVSLSDNRYNITISNIKEEILLEEEKEIDRYDVAIIYELVLRLKKILSETRFHNIPLQNIIIAVPGRVNSITGELQLSKQFDSDLFYGKNSIITIFENHFDAPVIMDNDINLSIIGEIKCGHLTGVKNAMVAYIDNGMGGALVLNNKFYGGDFGYAGEFGLMHTTFHGIDSYLDEFASLRSLKNYANKLFNREFNVAELVKEYKKKGQLYAYINETAHLVGHKLRDIIELLNISNIVLSGRVNLFGEDYLNCVIEEIKKSQNQCEIKYSDLARNSILFGAMSKSVDQTIAHLDNTVIGKVMSS